MHIQELKEAIGVEARATILNPKYIKEMMKGEASSAGQIQEIVTNMHGWEATRPELIDDALWNEVYEIYIEDKLKLGVTDFIKRKNVASLEEVTAVMLEATRKGMWKASQAQVTKLVELHTNLVKEFGVESSQFSSENKKLQQYIMQKASPTNAQTYQSQLTKAQQANSEEFDTKNSRILKKEENSTTGEQKKVSFNTLWVSIAVLLAFVGLIVFIRRRRKK